MIIDAATLPDGSTIEADFCIIGGGMVALTIARELASTGAELAILESGGLSASADVQALYGGSGRITGPVGPARDLGDYLSRSRARYFGGSGNVWGGKCGVLEPVDFEARDWVPNSGWPFGRALIDPFYDRACDLLEIPRLTQPITSLVDANRPIYAVGAGRRLVTQARFHTAFTGARGDRYAEWKDAVSNAPTVRVYLNANVTAIGLGSTGRHVEGLTVKCLDGRAHSCRARRYLLATGGLENVRLLLQSDDVQPRGVGNDRGHVGRCFSGHVNFSLETDRPSGIAFSRRDQPFSLYIDPDVRKVWGIMATTREAQRSFRLPNFWGTFSPPDGPTDAPSIAAAATWRVFDGTSGPQVAPAFAPVRFMVELESHPGSRVSLADDRDALGQRRLTLDWHLTAGDYDGLRRSIELFARSFGAEGLGRLRWPVVPEHLVALANPARHHMGTTRMHRDPAHGVVDADGRVHGIDNLWIGGSSVFPTGGVANPTLTIMALTLRLADHLRPVLRS